MMYGLLEGTVLALFVWLLLRLLPRQNARTRFILWFSALLAMFFLPLLAGEIRPQPEGLSSGGISSTFSLITLPLSWAIIIFAAWALIAAMNLARVIAGLWQVSRLRRGAEEIDLQFLSLELAQLLRDVRRRVSLRVSDRVQVPTAMGFLKPAVVLPRWFLNQDEISQQELKHVLVHELSHLRRRDDWTNLAQKLMKALLFFHPSAWWVEHHLSLEREMACDDEVLRQTASPLDYAQCLKRVAEKSFLRRQIALAQAVVSRMRQVTLRVTQILDADRPSTTRVWKPALPTMALAAALCGLSAWTAPALVSFTANPATQSSTVSADANVSRPFFSLVKQVNASYVPASTNLNSSETAQRRVRQPIKPGRRTTQMAALHPPKPLAASALAAAFQPPVTTYKTGDYVVQTTQFSLTMAGEQGTWHVQMWQVSVVSPADHSDKAIPRKKT